MKIDHEETNGAKIFFFLSSSSSFLRFFVSSWLIFILSAHRSM